MTAILNSLVTVLGAWLVVSPYLLGTRGVALAIAIAAGAILLLLVLLSDLLHGGKDGGTSQQG